MDEIQYTYKPCKRVLMEYIHENEICILWSSKPKHVFSKTKLFNLKCFVCVYKLEQSTTNLSFIFYLKHKILNLQNTRLKSWKSFSPSWFGPKLDPWASSLSTWYALEAQLLNQYVLASKLDFKSFVESKYRLRSW